MESMDTVSILLIVLALGAVTTALMFMMFRKSQSEPMHPMESAKAPAEPMPKQLVNLRVQAFERIILYLERINPERLVFRVNKPGMSARLLQSELSKIIRDEFDHNLAQQLYISPSAWEAVKAAREETNKILNTAAERVHKDADSLAFSQAILEVVASMDKLPTEVAIDLLKREFNAEVH